MSEIKRELEKRILVIDGAMGTMVQQHKLKEGDYRGHDFKNWKGDLIGCHDLLSITQPKIIKEIHLLYIEANFQNFHKFFRSIIFCLILQLFVSHLNLPAKFLLNDNLDKYTPAWFSKYSIHHQLFLFLFSMHFHFQEQLH